MSLATILSRASVGIEAPPVRVEVQITVGLPKFAIVGLPEATVRESKDRVRSAIINVMEEHAGEPDMPGIVGEYVASLRAGIDIG